VDCSAYHDLSEALPNDKPDKGTRSRRARLPSTTVEAGPQGPITLQALDTRRYLSPEEFALVTGLSLSTVHRRLARQQLPKIQPGGKGTRIMIPLDAIEIAKPAADNGQKMSPTNTKQDRTDKGYLSGRRPQWMSNVPLKVADRKSAPTRQDKPP
jgi:hypothetical protein